MPIAKLFCLLTAALCFNYSIAQSEIPEFGIFSSEEQNLKTVDFDKDADAVVLFDVATANYNDQHNLVLNRRIRIKILKEKGIRYGDIEIPFYSKDNFEYISNVEGIVQNFDEKGVQQSRLKRADIYEQKMDSRISVMKFALPQVKVGSILEYSYVSTCEHYGGLRDWEFQAEIPTLYSSMLLYIVPNTEFQYVVHKADDLPIQISPDKSAGKVTFTMKNIAGLRDEPFMDARRDYIQRVEFQLAAYSTSYGGKVSYLNTWKDVSKELMTEPYFGRQLDKKYSAADEAVLKINSLASPAEKMKYAHQYVRRSFSWNGHNSFHAEDGLKTVWETRKGTSGEINLALINLLKTCGLEVYPLLVSERNHGKINTTYPILDQFNKTVAYVVIGDEKYVLDATDQYTPVTLIPFNLLNTTAFLVDTKKGSIIELKDETKTHWNMVNIRSSISESGTVSGNTTVQSNDYARIERLKSAKQSLEKFRTNYFANNNTSIRIDSFEVNNTDNDSLSLDQQFNFSMPASSSGNYKLVNLNLFSNFQKNPFISDNRFSNINFGSRYLTDIHETFTLPSSLKAESLPKNITMVTPDKSFALTRHIDYKDNTVDVAFSIQINKPVFAADEYPMVQEYYKKMMGVLNEPIVLSSK
jgi:hypothetical protein